MEDANDPRRAIEAILMVADDPVEPHLLAQLLELAPARVEELCTEMAAAYEAERRGFILARVAGGYRFQSAPDLAPYLERFVLEGQSARLSAAALETLAIVAYKQPLSRAQVAAIRGVNVDGVMRTLQQRGYITEVGRDPGPGQAVLFGTTPTFLTKLGIDSLHDLPPLGAFVPGPDVMEALEHGLRVGPDDAGPAGDTADEGDDDGAVDDRPPAVVAAERGGEVSVVLAEPPAPGDDADQVAPMEPDAVAEGEPEQAPVDPVDAAVEPEPEAAVSEPGPVVEHEPEPTAVDAPVESTVVGIELAYAVTVDDEAPADPGVAVVDREPVEQPDDVPADHAGAGAPDAEPEPAALDEPEGPGDAGPKGAGEPQSGPAAD